MNNLFFLIGSSKTIHRFVASTSLSACNDKLLVLILVFDKGLFCLIT